MTNLQTKLTIAQNKTSTNLAGPSSFRVLPRGSTRREEVNELCERVHDILFACFSISGRDTRTSGRSFTELTRVRQIGMYVAHVTIGLSMQEVGDGFHRDRKTVAHACHVIEDLRDNPDFEHVLQMIEQIINVAFMCSPRG